VVLSAKDLTEEDHRQLNTLVETVLSKEASNSDRLLAEVSRLIHVHGRSPVPSPVPFEEVAS
jgi:hypothetical protein